MDWAKYEEKNLNIIDAFAKAESVLPIYKNVCVAVSGGSDSDIVVDMIERLKDPYNEVRYVWYNTGIEYQATKDHLKYLEKRYGITIEEKKAKKTIPMCVRDHGVPFLSKFVSDMMNRLQKHGFKWEDEPFDELIKKYPKCRSALKWWCNENGERLSISRNKWLKEFIVANPPDFLISGACCYYAKKLPAEKFIEENGVELNIIGVRQSEGGIRSVTYKNCYTKGVSSVDQFRPIFWLTDSDKKYYERQFLIRHSDCYTRYGLCRTGCVGCPYGRNVQQELDAAKKYEPKLYKLCIIIFGKSYEYTERYKKFCAEQNYKLKECENQLSFEDYNRR